MHLHKIRLHKKSCLAAATCPDNKDIFIPCILRLLRAAVHGNGVNRPEVRETKLITDHFGLEKDSYILFLGRLVPENGIRYLVEAFKNVKTDKILVIAGGSCDSESFLEELKDLAKGDDRILFTGFVQGAMLDFEKSAGEHSSTA